MRRCEEPAFVPRQLADVEIGRPLTPVLPRQLGSGGCYECAVVLVRLHGRPLGTVEVDLRDGAVEPEALASAIWRNLADDIVAHLDEDGIEAELPLDAGGLTSPADPRCAIPHGPQPFVSVVVATRDPDPSRLRRCLESLLRLDYPAYEVIVVDSAPSTTVTAALVQGRFAGTAQVRYVFEPVPGLARAHNRALLEASGKIVAFTDDDVVVDRLWLTRLVDAFASSPGVGCVTGLILPAELETPAQSWLEQFCGFGKGFQRQLFDLSGRPDLGPLYPYRLGAFGSGGNMAFDADALRALRGFDEALGAGTRAVGGDDLDAFLRVVLAGLRLVYEPAALVWHFHRRSDQGLRRQVRRYGTGLAAVLSKFLLNRATRPELLKRVKLGLRFLLSPSSPKNSKKEHGFPRRLTVLELFGILWGPVAYVRSRWRTRRLPSVLP